MFLKSPVSKYDRSQYCLPIGNSAEARHVMSRVAERRRSETAAHARDLRRARRGATVLLLQ